MTRPVLLKGLKVHPDNPLRLDFILSPGDSGLKGAALQAEGRRLIKDFLAALTLPEASLWVNLSPYERHRIIADGLDRTAMGRDLLQEDYELKQLTAMSLHPEREPGRSYWARVYRRAYDIYGTTRLPFQSRHRVWVVPDTVTFYEGGLGVFIVDSRMKVLTEGEYRGRRREAGEDERSGRLRRLGEEVLKEVVLPRIEEEVNHGPRFARLRQIYQAMLLADWYKEHLRKTILGRIYVDRSKLGGVDDVDRSEKERIFEAYLAAFRRGVYDFLREDVEPVSGRKIPRRYFSGGFTWRKPRKIEAAAPPPGEDLVLAEGVLNPVAAGPGKASSALQAVEGILSDRRIALMRPLKDMERRGRISFLHPQKIWVDDSSEDSIAWMTDPAGIMLGPPELSRDRAHLSERMQRYLDFSQKQSIHSIWNTVDSGGEVSAFLEQIGDAFRSERAGSPVGDRTDKALSDEELGEMRRLVPVWDWGSASRVTWAELVQDPDEEPGPKSELQERYFRNSVDVRRAFLELMRDLASAQQKGESVPLEDFKKRLAEINRIAVLGESGTSYYVRRVPSGRELEEWAKEVAGTYRPGKDLDRRLEIIFRALQRFIAVPPEKYRSDEDFLLLADIYLAAMPDYNRGQRFFFLTADNSMVMNLINTLLRLHGYQKGIPHENIDTSVALLWMPQLLQLHFQEMAREVNPDQDEPRSEGPVEEFAGKDVRSASVFEEDLARWEKDFPDLNWRRALLVPWREVVHDPEDQFRPEHRIQKWYWRNNVDARVLLLRLLEALRRNPEMDVEDFRLRLTEAHAALFIGLAAAEKLSRDRHSVQAEEIETPYLIFEQWRAAPLTGERVKVGKMDALWLAEEYRPWVTGEAGRERFGDLMKALRKVLTLPKEKFGTDEDIREIFAVYRASLPRISGQYLFWRGNNSFFMNLVNALLRLHGFRSGISHGHLDSRFLPKDALTDSAARPMEERFLEMVRERNRRASSAATDSVGGIDLNPAVLRRKTVGGGIEMNPDFDPRSLERMPIEGFAPVILRVVPLPDLPMFLGTAGEDGTDSTTLSLAARP